MAQQVQYYGTGRRKSSVARVRLVPGTGVITINGRPFVEYIPNGATRLDVLQPLNLTGTVASYDVIVNVCGGGITGQVDGATIHSGENHGDVNVIGVSGEETNAMSGGIVGYAINDSEIHQATNSGVATVSMAANCFSGGIAGYRKSDDGAVVYDCCSNEGLPTKWVGNATGEDDFIDKTEHTHE